MPTLAVFQLYRDFFFNRKKKHP